MPITKDVKSSIGSERRVEFEVVMYPDRAEPTEEGALHGVIAGLALPLGTTIQPAGMLAPRYRAIESPQWNSTVEWCRVETFIFYIWEPKE